MVDVQDIIKQQEVKLSQTNQSFGIVDDGIQDVKQKADVILGSFGTLEEAKNDTLKIVKDVADIAQQNAASTQETAASVDEVARTISQMAEDMEKLSGVADVLKENSSAFKL